jgi:hypothetical protein
MAYNWPAVVDAFNKIACDNVLIESSGERQRDFYDYTKLMFRQTGTFHPWDTDGELSRALGLLPEGRCNYRNVESYWQFKREREHAEGEIFDSLCYLFEEIGERLSSHFANPWNFAPGTPLPTKVKGKVEWAELASEGAVKKIIRASRRKK